MLSSEWRELETLCERISELRQRFSAAQRSKNVGLIDGLKDDLNRTVRLREQLVHHISARLGSATAEHAFNAKTEKPASADELTDETGDSLPNSGLSEDIEGFAN